MRERVAQTRSWPGNNYWHWNEGKFNPRSTTHYFYFPLCFCWISPPGFLKSHNIFLHPKFHIRAYWVERYSQWGLILHLRISLVLSGFWVHITILWININPLTPPLYLSPAITPSPATVAEKHCLSDTITPMNPWHYSFNIVPYAESLPVSIHCRLMMIKTATYPLATPSMPYQTY